MKRFELKQLRREQAEERNAAWNALTIEQRIASLLDRPGESKKQLARLRKQLQAGPPSPSSTSQSAQQNDVSDKVNRKKKQEAKELRAKEKRKEIDGH